MSPTQIEDTLTSAQLTGLDGTGAAGQRRQPGDNSFPSARSATDLKALITGLTAKTK